MAGGIAGAGGEFPSVLGRCFLHTKINHRITSALTCSEKAAANLSDQRELGLCFRPAHLHLAALFAWLTAKTQKSKSAAVGLEQSLLSPGATWGKMSVPPGRAALTSTRPPRSVCAGPRVCSGGAVPVVSRPRLRRAACRGAHLVATRSCDAPTSCCTVIPLEVWKIC